MSGSDPKRAFAARPGGADAWVRAPGAPAVTPPRTDLYTARLTIDITPELRGRIKIAAFGRGITVTEMLRAMLDDAFPAEGSV